MGYEFQGAFEALSKFTIEKDEHENYGLDHESLVLWTQLEQNIYRFITVAHQCFEPFLRASLLPTTVSALKYQKRFRTWHQADQHLRHCRDWFLMWIGLMSFRVACILTTYRGSLPWHVVLSTKGVPANFVSSVRTSVVCDFSVSCNRVGAFFKSVIDSKFSGVASMLWATGVPFWYAWNDQDAARANLHPSLSKWIPVPMKERPVVPFQNNLARQRDAVVATCPWADHFALHDLKHKEKEARETEVERGRRLNYARDHTKMINKGVKFRWSWQGLTLTRVRLSKEDAEDEVDRPWDEMRYDPWCNQWDICFYWGERYRKELEGRGGLLEMERVEEKEDEEEEEREMDELNQERVHATMNQECPAVPVPSMGEHRLLHPLPVALALRLHLGFVADTGHSRISQPSEKEWLDAVRPMGRTAQSKSSCLDPNVVYQAVGFLQSLVQGRSPAGANFDLDLANPHRVLYSKFSDMCFESAGLIVLRSSIFDDNKRFSW
ncbi:hypothetical protein CVT24_006504, partial [Panaeolus cyanescens]